MKQIAHAANRILRALPLWPPSHDSHDTAPIGFGVNEFETQVAELRTEIMSVGVIIPFALLAWSTVLARLIFTRGEVNWAPILVGIAIILGCGVCLWLKRPSTYRMSL